MVTNNERESWNFFKSSEFCSVQLPEDGLPSPPGEPSPSASSFMKSGIPIVVKDVTYSVVSNKGEKRRVNLLKNITAAFHPGRMSALMGSSGSGKTTLLDVMAGRKTVGEVQGTVLYPAQKASRHFLRRYTGYVEQFDIMLESLTVKEMLLYTAELKRPHTEPFEEKKAAVDALLGKLALLDCQDIKIGNALNRGISGGQAKRTSIAMAMITSPLVLFLDEPTSGLDSFTSNETMTLVKQLATAGGITIVATIHSPSPYTFELFHTLVMLSRGEVVYSGPNDESALAYFRGGCGIAPRSDTLDPAAPIHNTAEFLVDLIVGADRRNQGALYAEAYRASDAKTQTDSAAEALQSWESLGEAKHALQTTCSTVTPFWWALWVLIKYRTLKNYRNPAFLGPRIGDKIVFAILIILQYFSVGDDFSASNVYNIIAILYLIILMPAFGASMYIPSLFMERQLFLRERSDGLYNVITYLVARLLDEIMLAIPASLGTCAMVFFALKLQGSFVVFWLVYIEVLCIGIVLTYAVAAIAPTMEAANAGFPLFMTTLIFYGGLFMRFDDIPTYVAWYSKTNFIRYAWGALMVNQFGGGRDAPFGGTTILNNLSLSGVKIWENLVILACFFVLFFACAYIALANRRYSSR